MYRPSIMLSFVGVEDVTMAYGGSDLSGITTASFVEGLELDAVDCVVIDCVVVDCVVDCVVLTVLSVVDSVVSGSAKVVPYKFDQFMMVVLEGL